MEEAVEAAHRWDDARHKFGLAADSAAWPKAGMELLDATQALIPFARRTPHVDVIPFQRLARNLELQRYLGHGRVETFELLQLLPPMVREIGEASEPGRSSSVASSRGSVTSATPPPKANSHPVDSWVIEHLEREQKAVKLQDLWERRGKRPSYDTFRRRMSNLAKRGVLMKANGGLYWHPTASPPDGP